VAFFLMVGNARLTHVAGGRDDRRWSATHQSIMHTALPCQHGRAP